MKYILPLALCLAALAKPASAGTCTELKTCVALMHDLTGQHYIWNSNSTIVNFGTSPNFELTKENADVVFTAILDQSGYARAPVGDGKTYRIVRFSDRKEMELPTMEASAENAPTFGNTWDWVTIRYKVKSPELAPFLESEYRLHMPRESRLQADANTGVLIVSGATPVVRQMYETLKAADKPFSASFKEKMQADKVRRHEKEMAKIKSGKAD